MRTTVLAIRRYCRVPEKNIWPAFLPECYKASLKVAAAPVVSNLQASSGNGFLTGHFL